MKILIILDVIDSGGVSTVLRNILNHIDLGKFKFDILTFEENSEYEALIPDGVTVRHVYRNNPAKHKNKYIRYAYGLLREKIPKWMIRQFIIKYQYDIMIDFKGNNLNVLTAAKCKKVFWSHKDFSTITNPIEKQVIEVYSKTRKGRTKEEIFKKNICKVDSVVCISEACKQGFIERWGYDEARICVLYNVLDVTEIRAKSEEDIPYKKDSRFTFCCMTRISSGKGVERLLESTKLLNEEGYDFSLNIVGSGDTYDDVVSLSEKLGLKNVTFFGNKINPYPYVRESDVFVYPSETESYGIALCEALIIGKPIISCKTASVPEILGNNEFGYVIENSQEAVIKAMKEFLDKPQLRDIYACKAKNRASYFDVDNRIQEIERFLNGTK